jgi:lipid A ethanolaminephosphotransferase
MLGIRNRFRPMIRVETLVLVVVAWLVATANGAWWSAVGAGRDWMQPANWLFAVSCFVLLVALHFVMVAPLAISRLTRPLLTLIVVVTATASYFMRNYAVLMDPTMIQNVLHTDAHEAGDLLNLHMVGWVLLWSLLPVAYIWVVRLQPVPALRAVLLRAGSVLAALLVAVLALLTISRDLTSLMRNQREARYLITPGNLVWGLAANSLHRARDVSAPRETVGGDAHFVKASLVDGRPRVLVLVIGETARAANFSLFGYERDTNPELSRLGVTAFSNVKSCGTSTEISLPCMFSPYGREHYDESRIRNSESLLNVLARAGYSVKWLDNQSGCKGVCKGEGIEYQKLESKFAPDLCEGGECHDAILARRLEQELEEVRGNTVIVLHMMGNHGPAYFRRYPAAFRRFVPDCETAELRHCSREQVVNAYDNAILYTDHVVASVIETLRGHALQVDGAMIYVSDHGESLGEHGLYLHGIPYSIAPELQTHVPMLVWVSRQLTASGDVDNACLRDKVTEPLSHDNLFHSVLGLMDVQTRAYSAAHDIFSGCRGGVSRSLARTGAQANGEG